MGSKPYILIVDDEADIREPVGTYLGMNGFEVALAASTSEALSAIQHRTPDLALLDIMLGDDDGMDLCKKLQNTSDIAVIFLSGRSEETERIIGLELGADDYVVKPFNPRELLARIKAVLRRKGKSSQVSPSSIQRIAFGPWIFDPAQHEIVNEAGEATALSSGETILLQTFLAQPQKIFTRDQLMDALQGREMDVFDRAIDNYIARLRKKIEENAKEPKLIKTFWGKGYALACDRELLP